MTFVEHLSRYAPADWAGAVDTLAAAIHPIDRDATRVWCAFFPAGPPAGDIDTSHLFLYGHRYWPQVKRAILAAAEDTSWPAVLPDVIAGIADRATRTTQVDRDQLLGITTASLVTLGYAGMDAFTVSAGTVQLPRRVHVKSIRQIRRARAGRGQIRRMLASLAGRRRFRMTFSEASPAASFDVVEGETITSGMPAGMRACASPCSGACVIGVLAGTENLSPLEAQEESLLKASAWGHPASVDGRPLIRLACHARPSGDVSFVIRPPERNSR